MAEDRFDWQKVLDELETQRDELRLKLHLAKADARDQWQEIEKKLEALRAKLGVVGREAGKTAEGVGVALDAAAAEIKRGFERIRALL